MPEPVYISVILPLKLRWVPSYRVDLPEEGGAAVPVRGTRVSVRFHGRVYVGVVSAVGVTPEVGLSKVLPVEAVEELPPVTEEELALWEFIADYYLCSVGEVYQAAYPSLRLKEEKVALRRKEAAALREVRQRETLGQRLAALELRRDKKMAQILLLKPSGKRYEENKRLYENQLQSLLEQINKVKSSLEALRLVSPSGPGGDRPLFTPENVPQLTNGQQKAKDLILKAFGDNKIALLNGITGSGKTEIYVSLALDVLASGKSVLYMVPEIAMTCQLEYRLRQFFGERLLCCSSLMTPAARRDVAYALADGPYVLLGTRSSIFLPHRNLGLVVVDEEHESSYKQDSLTPRYHGRDCAVKLGSIHGCPVLLGSATPSLESIFNCMSGRYVEVDLKERYWGDVSSELEVIDTIAERRKRGMVGSFSRKLIAHMHDALEAGEQVLILRGRRSYSPLVQCGECGSIPKCPHCNVSLSFHKDRNALICHYCGYSEQYHVQCAECGGNRVFLGSGTQRVEEEVSQLFPQARVARLDGDSLSSAQAVVKAFSDGEVDILVGTQIIAKGFDFGRLSLVAVLQSDTLLGQEDFRADERAFQLLGQLRGRAGRRGRGSLFVIQTSQPSHPVYGMLDDAPSFVNGELLARRDFNYPPFVRMVCLTVRGNDPETTSRNALALASALRREFASGRAADKAGTGAAPVITGPCAPPVDKVADEFIRQVRISFRRDASLAFRKRRLKAAVEAFEADRSFSGRIVIDVDPI